MQAKRKTLLSTIICKNKVNKINVLLEFLRLCFSSFGFLPSMSTVTAFLRVLDFLCPSDSDFFTMSGMRSVSTKFLVQ